VEAHLFRLKEELNIDPPIKYAFFIIETPIKDGGYDGGYILSVVFSSLIVPSFLVISYTYTKLFCMNFFF
jgi:hypothetical protein